MVATQKEEDAEGREARPSEEHRLVEEAHKGTTESADRRESPDCETLAVPGQRVQTVVAWELPSGAMSCVPLCAARRHPRRL